jgi:hypothetical protein
MAVIAAGFALCMVMKTFIGGKTDEPCACMMHSQ